MGFAPDAELLLCVSSRGRGVFHGVSRRRVAWDADEAWAGDGAAVEGIGPLRGASVPMEGIQWAPRWALPKQTRDGWGVGALEVGGHVFVWLAPPGVRPDDVARVHPLGVTGSDPRFEDLRTAGFSSSGRCLAVAEQHTLHLFTRAD